MLRQFPRTVKRVVIKVGSSVVATDLMKPRTEELKSLANQICTIQKKGVDVVLVSSGAIVLGMGELDLRTRPKELPALQALAAVGQTVLMSKYMNFFKDQKSTCAQILLTWDDFDNRTRYNSARLTFEECFKRGVVPIVNENDTIATDEIKFGDNDKLSALVAGLVQADLLIILTDVEGFYDLKSSEKKVFEEIKEITSEIEGMAGGSKNVNISRGGMIAKLSAIKIATKANVPCVMAKGQMENVLTRILGRERIGTFFFEKEDKVLARKHWISFGAKPKGTIVIDDGAKKAILKGGVSLLLPGVSSFDGHFKKEDVVVIKDEDNNELGRGIINYSVSELAKLDDKKGKKEAIHCDDLVLSEQ